MQNKNKHSRFTPQDNLVSILPSVVAGIILLFITIGTILYYFPPNNPFDLVILVLYGVIGSLYLGFFYFIFTASLNKSRFSWITAIAGGISLSLLMYMTPEIIDNLLYALLFVASLSASIISNRGPAYFLVFIFTSFYFSVYASDGLPAYEWIIHINLTIAAIIGIETIQQLKNLATQQINRLEIVNELSKQIVSTLDTKQVYSLLNAVFQNALEADSYYIGIIENDQLNLVLFYDDGEYFNDIHMSKKGTLSNWVITHQQELFLPDIRQGLQLEDVEVINIGRDKPTLSWLGVPMRGSHVNGVMAISSYHPNAFNRGDMELLSTIAQRAALALDNTYNHALVQKQARLDNLTRVFNHGYFIQTLNEQSIVCLENKQPLSLIMLDIDYFKQYNDKFGHLLGDEILVNLCDIIRSHIKNTDAVGRWGGEEFAISLPNTNDKQAMYIAERIRESMISLKVDDNGQTTLPVPTVSQGIAVFPAETEDITKLIDLADKRLYIAKERGRDQIEPMPTFWENTKPN
jgi:diguanylate cyclase (GGDEF)-like protein